MLITLLEDVKALGREGQKVEVPDGYAINFLFPQHLAVDAALEKPEDLTMKAPTKGELEEEKIAAELDGMEVVVKVKGVKGKPKDPVTATEIRAALKEQGIKVEKRFIKTEPITIFQTLEVPVEFPSGFESLIRVTVEPT